MAVRSFNFIYTSSLPASADLECGDHLRVIQDHYLDCLQGFVEAGPFAVSTQAPSTRFGELLLLLPQLQSAAELLLNSKMFYVPFLLNSLSLPDEGGKETTASSSSSSFAAPATISATAVGGLLEAGSDSASTTMPPPRNDTDHRSGVALSLSGRPVTPRQQQQSVLSQQQHPTMPQHQALPPQTQPRHQDLSEEPETKRSRVDQGIDAERRKKTTPAASPSPSPLSHAHNPRRDDDNDVERLPSQQQQQRGQSVGEEMGSQMEDGENLVGRQVVDTDPSSMDVGAERPPKMTSVNPPAEEGTAIVASVTKTESPMISPAPNGYYSDLGSNKLRQLLEAPKDAAVMRSCDASVVGAVAGTNASVFHGAIR